MIENNRKLVENMATNPHEQKKLLEAKRAHEDMILAMQHTLKDQATVSRKSNFEIKTTAKIEKRQKNEVLEKIREDRANELYYRKHELSQLYNQELEGWKQEVLTNVETIEERKDRIMRKAFALRDARESARQEYVTAAYQRQWRDANDDSRTLNSNELSKFMAAERMKQTEDNARKREQEDGDNEEFLAEWQRQLDAIAAKDQAKQDRRHKANMDQAVGLREQMDYNETQRQKNYDLQQEADEQEIRECRDAINSENEKLRRLKEEAHARGREVQKFNSTYKDIAIEKAKVSSEQDRILLDYALEQERLQIKAENDKKKAAADAAKQYRKYLELLMIKEAEDNSFVDEMNQREFEKVQKARDDALQAREDARSHLMALVKQGREEQIAYKKQRDKEQVEADRIYASKFAGDIKEGLAMDAAAANARREKAMNNNVMLIKQIGEREMRAKLDKQEIYLEEKRMKHIERKHKSNLANQKGSVRLDYRKRNPLL